MDHLLELVRTATGPDRNLDYLVFVTTSPDNVPSAWDPAEGHLYTSDLNAAFDLVDRVLPGWSPSLATRGSRYVATVTEPSPSRPPPSVSNCRPTRQLALVAVLFTEVGRLLRFDAADAAAAAASLAPGSLSVVIREARLARGSSQYDVALDCGVSQTTVSALESGRSTYGAELVLRWLGLDPAEVLTESDLNRPLRSRGAWRGRRSSQG